jgi:hypothetical protein
MKRASDAQTSWPMAQVVQAPGHGHDTIGRDLVKIYHRAAAFLCSGIMERRRAMLRELWAAILDTMHEGDLWQHLAAWWRVATGRETPETRAGAARGGEVVE